MCWKPKVKVPKMDTNQIRAAEPAPLTEPPKSVVWGGDDDEDTSVSSSEDTSVSSSEVPTTQSSGKSSLKVKLDDSAAKNKSKSSIHSKAFG